MMTTEHGMAGVMVLAALLLALVGALRWDLLRLWWPDLLETTPLPPAITPPLLEKSPPHPPYHSPHHLPHYPPHHLHPAESVRPARYSKPSFHRSGRRG